MLATLCPDEEYYVLLKKSKDLEGQQMDVMSLIQPLEVEWINISNDPLNEV
jgi:hypothetical protein